MSRLSRVVRTAALLLALCATPAAAVQPPAPEPDLSAPLLRATPTGPTTLPTVWACHPGQLPNPCTGGGETTVLRSAQLRPRRVDRVDPSPDLSAAPPVDCFFVYGTVTSAQGTNAPRYADRDVLGLVEAQAARFSSTCRVFAPIYRQVTSFVSIGSSMATGQTHTSPSQDVAFSDVLGAWRDYLAHDNHGRGVVLIGHSQGAAMLIRMMERDIDRNAAARRQLVGAILPGGNFTVRRGKRLGGNFAYIPTCAEPGEYGCVVAYSAFGTPPGGTAMFGRLGPLNKAFGGPTGSDFVPACTNPATLAGDGNRLRPVLRSRPPRGAEGLLQALFWNGLRPTASTTWVVPGDRFTGRCRITRTTAALMVRAGPGSLQPQQFPWPDWGLHGGEMSLTLDSLVRIAGLQSAAWLADHPAAG